MKTCRAGVAVLAAAAAAILIVPVLLVGAIFWLVAALTRSLIPLLQPSVVDWPTLIEFDPQLGWKPKAGFRGHCVEARDDVFEVQIGPDGWAGRHTVDESRVVIIGDSFAFGYGVDADKTYFNLNPELGMKPVAAPGYNMVQEVLLLEELSGSLQGKTVLWFVYVGNDLYDNLSPEMTGYRCPFVVRDGQGDWKIVTSHISSDKWWCSSGRQGKRRAHIYQNMFTNSYLSKRAFSACEYLIKRARAICDRARATLLVVTIPFPQMLEREAVVQGRTIDPQYADDTLRGICEQWGVPILHLKDALSRADYKRDDEHWNERGHRKVAEIIAAACTVRR
jgi:hypothetical protein